VRIKSYSLVGFTSSNTTYAAAQASTVNVAFTLTGAAAVIAIPVELTLTSAANLSAITYTIVGKDRNGFVITETILGPNANTVKSRKIYSSITSITPDTTNAGTMSVGNPQRVCSPWINSNSFCSTEFLPTMRGSTEIVTGAPTGVWEFTNENVVNISGEGAFVDGTVSSTPAAAGDTQSIQGAYVRYVCTSATGTAIKIRVARPTY
jgi:hypothetical protein